MHIGLQIPSFKYPGGTAAIRPKLKEIVTTAEESGFYSLWVMDHYYQTYHSRICRAKFPGGRPRRVYRSDGRPNRARICCWV